MGKNYITVNRSNMPDGPHMTQGDIDSFVKGLTVGQTIIARYMFKMDETAGHIHPLSSLGHPVPGAILNRHEFKIRAIYRHQLELETFDRGEMWVCYVSTRAMYMYKERTLIYSIRRAG